MKGRNESVPWPAAPQDLATMEDLRALHLRDLLMNERDLKDHCCHWPHLLRIFSGRDPRSLTTRDVEDYKGRRLAEGAARQTANNGLSVLRRALNLARQQGFLKEVPFIKLLQVNNVRTGFLDPDEFKRLIKTLEVLDENVAAAVKVLYLLGWRRSEVLNMKWDEVNLRQKTLALPAARNKGRVVRRVKLPRVLLELFRAQWKNRRGAHVFHRRGKPILDFRGTWKRAVEALGRPKLLCHDTRRSYAKNSIQAGVSQATIMSVAGHKTPSMFFRYAIIDEGMMAEGLERSTAFVEGNGGA